jgi:uncharacterized protein YutE (UPF0331/DUF86 family)
VSPIDAAIVRGKLGHIMTSLDLLRPMRAMALADYRARVWERKGVERVLQEAIEAALDINAHVIAGAARRPRRLLRRLRQAR